MSDLPRLYRQMVLVRHFEDEVLRLADEGHVPGVVHPYNGHEAIAVGALATRSSDEWVVGYYRCHGHALASGSDPEALLREMLDRTGAICGGKSGSMHLSDRSSHFLLASSIVGSQLSIAAGVALSEKSAQSGKAVVVFCGDGALGAGVAYEALTIARRLSLPLLVVCEDNGWQDQTRSEWVTSSAPASLLAGLGLPVAEVDGNDVTAVAAAAETALGACRAGHGPQVIVAHTYLQKFHSQLRDMRPGEYRLPDDVASWMDRDPLSNAAAQMVQDGKDIDAVRTEVVSVVSAAVTGAMSAPMTDPALALTAVTVAPWDDPADGSGLQ